MPSTWKLHLAVASLGIALSAPAGVCRAEAEQAPAPDVPLEKLLKLPDSVATTPAAPPRRGGRTRAEWRERFEKAQADVAKAKRELDDSRKEMEDVAPDEAWSMTAPGLPVQASPSETSIDFRLRQQIRRQREELERAEHRLQELGVEANLAGVPEDWRASADAEKTSAASQP